MASARAKPADDVPRSEDAGASPGAPPATIARRDAAQIRLEAEAVRRILKDYARRGGSSAPFLPRIKRAQRLVRRGDADGALRVLRGLERGVRQRIRADEE